METFTDKLVTLTRGYYAYYYLGDLEPLLHVVMLYIRKLYDGEIEKGGFRGSKELEAVAAITYSGRHPPNGCGDDIECRKRKIEESILFLIQSWNALDSLNTENMEV